MTQRTNAVTRNIWKTLRALVVWVASLLLYAFSQSLGEPLDITALYKAGGLLLILVGIRFYYKAAQPAHAAHDANSSELANVQADGPVQAVDVSMTGDGDRSLASESVPLTELSSPTSDAELHGVGGGRGGKDSIVGGLDSQFPAHSTQSRPLNASAVDDHEM